MTQEGDIRVFNPNKEIATSITLEILIRHRDALKQARLGYVGDDISITENVKRINQVRGLNLITQPVSISGKPIAQDIIPKG